jgi:hypothetical protein
LIEIWGGQLPGFNQFLYQSVVPACLAAIANPEFDFHDAGTMQVLIEISRIFKTIHKKYGDEFLAFLRDYLGNIPLLQNSDLGNSFLMQLASNNNKELQNKLKVIHMFC